MNKQTGENRKSIMQSLYYREIEPDPALRAFVTCYWEFVAREIPGGFYDHVVMPDGCVTIVYGRNAEEGSCYSSKASIKTAR